MDFSFVRDWLINNLMSFLWFNYFTWTTTVIIAWRFYVHWQKNKRELAFYRPVEQPKITAKATIPIEYRKFKGGERVTSTSMRGPIMSVIDYEGDRVRCRWFDKNESKTDLFSEGEIVLPLKK